MMTETWVVIWFPPDVPERSRSFNSESKARKFIAREPDYDSTKPEDMYPPKECAPLLVHRIVETTEHILAQAILDPEVQS